MTGELAQIPETQYLAEQPYYSLDDDPPVESNWGRDADVKRFWVSHAPPGQYQLELIGIASGSYHVGIFGASGSSADTEIITGSTTAGQRTIITFHLNDSRLRIQALVRQTASSFKITAVGEPNKPITLQGSSDLISGWGNLTSDQSGTGVVELTHSDPSNPARKFFRVTQ